MTTTPKKDIPEPDLKGLAAARAYAGWHLGYPDWADLIIEAYLDPEATRRTLAAEKADHDRR